MENRLTEIFNETDKIEVHSDNICVNCGANLGNDYATHCEICGYDFTEPFKCPYQLSSSVKQANGTDIQLVFCSLSRKQCKVQGLDYEICPVFRSLDSIKGND